jgi:hypothetical protein
MGTVRTKHAHPVLHTCTFRKSQTDAKDELTKNNPPPGNGAELPGDDLSIPDFRRRPYQDPYERHGRGRMVANGFAISHSTEDRKPMEPGQIVARVWIKEIRHPALKSGPDDDLDDFKIYAGR